MDAALRDEAALWAAVVSGAVSLRELETDYDYDDFLRLVAYREYQNDIAEKVKEENRGKDAKNSR